MFESLGLNGAQTEWLALRRDFFYTLYLFSALEFRGFCYATQWRRWPWKRSLGHLEHTYYPPMFGEGTTFLLAQLVGHPLSSEVKHWTLKLEVPRFKSWWRHFISLQIYCSGWKHRRIPYVKCKSNLKATQPKTAQCLLIESLWKEFLNLFSA
jgi:hypothetical protein